MKTSLAFAALMLFAVPVAAQAQGQAFTARTAGELADLCGTKPTDAPSAARLNFCLGYAQATMDAEVKQTGGKRSYCIPNPSPSRQATMVEFAGWVRATPANAGLNSQDALMRFMAQRFPCKT
ncbi:MAG: hypothetical protein FJY55_06545 [Betaproteobacteria bacterium]|nr:hypothetical protein [Betaproteobacteria bacterium]